MTRRVWNPNTQNPTGFRDMLRSLLIERAPVLPDLERDVESLAPYESAQGSGFIVALRSGKRLVVTVSEDDGSSAVQRPTQKSADMLVVWRRTPRKSRAGSWDHFEVFRHDDYESDEAMRSAAIARYDELRADAMTHSASVVECVRSTDYAGRE